MKVLVCIQKENKYIFVEEVLSMEKFLVKSSWKN